MLIQNKLLNTTKIGLILGNGLLPYEIITNCKKNNLEVFAIYLENEETAPEYLKDVPHIKLNIGLVGKAFTALKSKEIKHIIFAGGIKRPKLSKLKLDTTGTKLLAKVSKSQLGGDNSLLSIVIRFFEEAGFIVNGIQDICTDIILPKGNLGKTKPGKQLLNDIKLGANIVRKIGELDIGQRILISKGNVFAVEAIEGTDFMLERCASLALSKNGGVLIKMKKPNQDNRIDLPTIGPRTIENAHKAGLNGIAVEAGSTLIVEKEKVTRLANKLKLFVLGI